MNYGILRHLFLRIGRGRQTVTPICDGSTVHLSAYTPLVIKKRRTIIIARLNEIKTEVTNLRTDCTEYHNNDCSTSEAIALITVGQRYHMLTTHVNLYRSL